jgi:hypothetical protein
VEVGESAYEACNLPLRVVVCIFESDIDAGGKLDKVDNIRGTETERHSSTAAALERSSIGGVNSHALVDVAATEEAVACEHNAARGPW